MKITKKITSVVLALLLAISAFAGLAITANAVTNYDADGQYTLNIHKGNVAQDGDDTSAVGNTSSQKGTTVDAELNGFTPLKKAGIKFKVYFVDDNGIDADGNWIDTSKPENDTTKYSDPYEAVTNGEGVATFKTNTRGLYYVIEDMTSVPASVTYKTASPFYVFLPLTTQNTESASQGFGSENTVDVYPKNLTTLGGATLQKTINTLNPSEAGQIAQYPQFTLYEVVNGKDTGAEGETPDDVAITVVTIGTAYNSVLGDDITAGTTDDDDRYETVKIAQKDGKIAVDGLPTGDYYFKETRATQVAADTDLPLASDFEFTIAPGKNVTVTTADDDEDNNVVFGAISTSTTDTGTYSADRDNSVEPKIHKTVTNGSTTTNESNLDGGSVSVGDSVTWTITPDVPSDIASYTEYTVTDELDFRLDAPSADDVTVTATTTEPDPEDESKTIESPVELTKDTDYTVNVDEDTSTVTVAFTTAGVAKLKGAKLVISFATKVNQSAASVLTVDIAETEESDGNNIYNQAVLSYKNQYATTTKTAESEKPYIYTGGFQIVKVDAQNTEEKLSAVEFKLYSDKNMTKEIGCTTAYGADSENYRVNDGTRSTVPYLVTKGDGSIKVYGLAYGTYYLKETKTNNGYQLLSEPIEITVGANTSLEANRVTVKNVKQPDLPFTGGTGTIMFTVAGLVLVGGSAFLFIRSRKNKKNEA